MKHTFRMHSPIYQMRYALGASVFVLALMWFVVGADALVMGVLAGVLVISMVFGYWLLRRSRLVITDSEIAYYGSGFRVSAPWEMVTGYGTVSTGPVECEALILAEPRMEFARWIRVLRPAAALDPTSAIAMRRYDAAMIPVGLYQKDWRQDTIGDLVRQYALRGLRPAPGHQPARQGEATA